MDGRGQLITRNWEFTDNWHSESLTKPTLGVSLPESNASGYHPGFLKIGTYSDRSAMMAEHHSVVSSLDFSWVQQRNFLHPTKINNQLQSEMIFMDGMPTSSEMISVPSMPIAESTTIFNLPIDAKPINTRKQSPSRKKAKSIATKIPKPKEPKKQPSAGTIKKESSTSTGKWEKMEQDSIFNAVMMDISGVPAPVCSCTGVPRQCYRWGRGGWQSSCCTTNMSEYPLPMNSSRPGTRMAGRKMSIGAYAKLLHRLAAAEGLDLSYAVDLKNHWARHGTNKFVTIK